METLSKQEWMKFEDGKLFIILPDDHPPKRNKPSTLTRCASEPIISVGTFGYEIIKVKKHALIPDKILINILRSRTLFPEDTSPNEIKDFESVIKDNVDKPSGLSCSCNDLVDALEVNFNSCAKFSTSCNDLDDLLIPNKVTTLNLESRHAYNEAVEIYDMYQKLVLADPNFLKIEHEFQFCYPSLWQHLIQEGTIYLDPETVIEENQVQWSFIETCQNILVEEELILCMKRTDDIPEFIGGETLIHDSYVSAMFLKYNYSPIFIHLVKNRNFMNVYAKKVDVLKKRLEVLKILEKPVEELAELEEKYSIK